MSKPQPLDLVIVGAGMVGLALANALRGLKLRIAVLDARPSQDLFAELQNRPVDEVDHRVSALNTASENLLRHLGAWPMITELGAQPYRRMQVWDGEGTSDICFDAAELQRAALGHIVENRVIVAALQRLAEQNACIELLFGCRVVEISPSFCADEGGASLRSVRLSDGTQLSTPLVVAADGAHSQTRQLLGLTHSEWSYGQQALVANLTLSQGHQNSAWQCFTDDGPLAWLPLADSSTGRGRVSIVWSTSPDHARELMALDSKAFCHRVGRAFNFRLGEVLDCGERAAVPLVQRHAPYYVTNAGVLVGDAAHSIHPLAGQGVNLGFADAAALAEVVSRAVSAGESLASQTVLRRYQRRRQAENLAMIGLMAGFHHLYGRVPPPVQWLRNLGLRQVGSLAPLRRWLAEQAAGGRLGSPALLRSSASGE